MKYMNFKTHKTSTNYKGYNKRAYEINGKVTFNIKGLYRILIIHYKL